jgi:hypothetical protein
MRMARCALLGSLLFSSPGMAREAGSWGTCSCPWFPPRSCCRRSWPLHPGRGRTIAAARGAVVAASADRRIDPAVSRRRVLLCLHGRGARHSSRHDRRDHRAVQIAGDPRAIGHDAASGGTTPMESIPVWLQYLMQIISPTPHFVAFSQALLYRGADLSIVWPQLLAIAAIGGVYFAFALSRFRRVIFGG